MAFILTPAPVSLTSPASVEDIQDAIGTLAFQDSPEIDFNYDDGLNKFSADLKEVPTVTPGAYTNASLTVDSKGRLTSAASGAGASAAGLDTQVQFNDGGAFGGASSLVYDKSLTAASPFKVDLAGRTSYTNGFQVISLNPIPATGNFSTLRSTTTGNTSSVSQFLNVNHFSFSGGSYTNDHDLNTIVAQMNTTNTYADIDNITNGYGTTAIRVNAQNGSTVGASIGVSSHAFGGNKGVGLSGIAHGLSGTTPQAYGVRGTATQEGSAQSVGVYGRINTTHTSASEKANPGVSAAAIFDNGNTTSDLLNLRNNNVEVLSFTDGNQMLNSIGAVGAPAYSFLGDATTGVLRVASGQIGFSAAGVLQASVISTGLSMPAGKRITFTGGSFISDEGSNTIKARAAYFAVYYDAGETGYFYTANDETVLKATAGTANALYMTDVGAGRYLGRRSAGTSIRAFDSGYATAWLAKQGSTAGYGYSFHDSSSATNDDSNTRMYSSAADTINFDTAGTLRVTIASDGKLLAQGAIGVGNSAAATTLGTVVKKMEIFDAAGASLGFIPIYDAIT